MTKKDYILKLLEALKDTWPMANGLKLLVEGNVFDKNTIDALTNIFINAVNSTNDEIIKNKMKTGIEIINEIKEKEAQSKELDQEDINKLDLMLKNI